MGDDRQDIIYCYDPSRDKWTTLPPLPVKWFGVSQVNGKLVAVGGVKVSCGKWKQAIPPIPTARNFPGILSLHSALIVAAGYAYPP